MKLLLIPIPKIFFSKIFSVLILFFIYMFITFLSNLYSCDETLFAFITATNPSNEFVKHLSIFFNKLSLLGNTLKIAKDQASFIGSIESIMNSWLDITTKFGNAPPVEFESDKNWTKKFHEVANRLGKIRKNIKCNDFKSAHDEVLSLSNNLFNFFENMKMSKMHKLMLEISLKLNSLSEYFSSNNLRSNYAKINNLHQDDNFEYLDNIVLSVNEISKHIKVLEYNLIELKSYVSNEMLSSYDEILKLLSNFKETFSKHQNDIKLLFSNSNELKTLVNELYNKFQTLRAGILFVEWFSK